MNDNDTTGGITRADIGAALIAEEVSAHYHDGRGMLRLYLRDISRQRIFKTQEQRLFPDYDSALGRTRDIAVRTTMRGYTDNHGFGMWNLTDSPEASAFKSIFAGPAWQTIAGILRPGDDIVLSWLADNNNDNVRDAGLHVDQLDLVVLRRGPHERVKTLRFNLGFSVGLDNGARMIRRYGK